MVLGKLPVPGRPTILVLVGQGPIALAVGADGGCLDIFTLICRFFPLSPSLWETARYRLKYCLKGPLNPKPTNQPNLGKEREFPPLQTEQLFHINCSLCQILPCRLDVLAYILRYSRTSMARTPSDHENMFEIGVVRANECLS